ncbi:MAG: hypothetical protein JSU94_03175 [Phycisphaerales bacterium]|nr:MAG: hypothetical protein JSU94_03175 [Phycisphaerales bacterium]
MIFTDVYFGKVKVFGAKSSLAKEVSDSLVLTCAGGSIGNLSLRVSDTPDFEIGKRYVVFSLYDGKDYVDPLVGGSQGRFRIIKDSLTGVEYPLSQGGRGIASIANGKIKSAPGIETIKAGTPVYAPVRPAMLPAPASAGNNKARSRRALQAQSVLTADELLAEALVLLESPPKNNGAVSTGRHKAGQQLKHLQAGDKTSIEGKKSLPLPVLLARREEQTEGTSDLLEPAGAVAAAGAAPGDGDPLCWCGEYDLPIVMEQVPETWPSYNENFIGMNLYNRFVEIYKYKDDDGSFGDNYESEFCGFATNDQLDNVYDSSWGTAIAKIFCWIWYGDCGEIIEADILFRAGLDWRYNPAETIDVNDTVLYRPVLLHELGHSWGLELNACGKEYYNYNKASVMHRYYHHLVEDGEGLHQVDVYALRDIYKSQRTIKEITDIGVESYYADSNLVNATTDAESYRIGDSLTVQNITVENMSSGDVPNVRLRLYLSEDTHISTSDHLMGQWPNDYFQWPTFFVYGYWTGDLTTTVPTVPSGQYYVGMIVTIGGDSYAMDDYSGNNRTRMLKPVTIQCTPPLRPAGVTASKGTESDYVVVSWDHPTTPISHWKIYRQLNRILEPSELIEDHWTNVGYHDPGIERGKEYLYWLTAVNLCGAESPPSKQDFGWRSGECHTPPDYAYTIAPSGQWKTTGTSSFVRGGCHVYRMYLDSSRGYDFSVCSNDGSGGSCAVGGLGRFRMYNSSGSELWTLTAGGSCASLASTLGTAYEAWGPPSTGYYYLKVDEQSGRTLTYNLAYRHHCPNPAPTNLLASDGSICDYVYVSWDAMPGATEYQVERTGGFPSDRELSPWQAETYWIDDTAQANKLYTYRVTAWYSVCGPSGQSESDTGYRRTIPSAPQNIRATDGDYCDRVRVVWDEVPDAGQYRVYRDSIAISDWQAYWAYDDKTALPAIVYTYQVRSRNTCGQSGLTPGDTGFTTAIAAPENVEASDGEYENKVVVTWSPPGPDVQYQVWRDGSALTDDWRTDTAHVDYTADYCTVHTYQVKAKHGCGQVVASETDTGFWGGPAEPANPKPGVSDRSVTINPILSWSGDPKYIILDDFNRADSAKMGSNWVQQAGDFSINKQQAVAGSSGLITLAGRSYDHIAANVSLSPTYPTQHAALVLGYRNLNNNIYIKMEGKERFQQLAFDFGYNGINNVAWPDSGVEGLSPSFRSAKISARLDGDTVIVEIDSDFDGAPDQAFSRGNIPTKLLGSAIGLGGGGGGRIDDFAFAASSVRPNSTEHYEDFAHPRIDPILSTSAGGERSVAVTVADSTEVSALAVKAGIGKAAVLTVTIHSVKGVHRDRVLASEFVSVPAGPVRWLEVPISFKFRKNYTYDIGFNVTNDWGYQVNTVEFYTGFFNAGLDVDLGYGAGNFVVLSGGEWPNSGYKNNWLPHVRAKVLDSCNTVYDVYLGTSGPPDRLVAEGLAEPSMDVLAEAGDLLEPLAIHLWQVVARNCCSETASPIWSFETEQVADLDGDYNVTMTDMAFLADSWARSNCSSPEWCERSDMDFDSNVLADDLKVLSENWLKEGLRYKDLDARKIASMRGRMTSDHIDGSDSNELGSGTFLIYVTDEGRYGKFVVRSFDKANGYRLTIDWITYNADGSIYSAGDELVIRGTYFCDLDEGLEVTTGSDFHWSMATTTTRSLNPRNGAKFKLVRRFD